MALPGFRRTRVGSGGLGAGNVARGTRSGGFSVSWHPSPLLIAGQMEKFGIDIRSFHEPLKRSIQQVIIPSINMNFDWEGRPEWTPLADYTLTRRNNEGFGEGPILQRTGRLRQRATAFARWKVTREEAFVDNFPSDVWYAQVQHEGIGISGSQLAQQKGVDTSSMKGEGGMFPRKKGEVVIPPRPFMLVQEEDLDKIEDVFKEWIRERMFKAGLLT